MDEPTWLLPDIVTQVHSEQLAEHGGQDGLRDLGLLDSALNRPHHTWAYTIPKPDLPALAASLAFGVARNHPFLDGNKRTAWVLCRSFLQLNGLDVRPGQEEIVSVVLALAAGEITEEAFADWLRQHTKPLA
jgi:death-on-curing protein